MEEKGVARVGEPNLRPFNPTPKWRPWSRASLSPLVRWKRVKSIGCRQNGTFRHQSHLLTTNDLTRSNCSPSTFLFFLTNLRGIPSPLGRSGHYEERSVHFKTTINEEKKLAHLSRNRTSTQKLISVYSKLNLLTTGIIYMHHLIQQLNTYFSKFLTWATVFGSGDDFGHATGAAA